MDELSRTQPRFSLRVTVTTLLVCFAFVFRIASPISAELSYVLIGMVALLGRRQAVIALALSWFFTMINPALAPDPSFGAIGRFFVIMAAAVSVFMRYKTRYKSFMRDFIWLTWFFAFFVLMHSLLVSPVVDVSVLKLTSWLIVFLTLLSAWGGLIPEARTRLANQLFWALVALVLLSLPLIVLPVGYLRNGHGFQGLLSHPQAFGVAMAFLGVWAFSRVLRSRRILYAEFVVFFLAFLLIFASESRTAAVALALAISATVALLRLTSKKTLKSLLPAFQSKNFRFCVLAVALALLIFTPKITQVANDFISKSGRADASDLISAYELSRSALYLPMLENIAADPWRGIGYGMASESQSMVVKRDLLFGLPISAPVEKGNVPLAILEELGIFGLIVFILWLLVALLYAIKGGVIGLALISVVLLINFGEAMFFSPGGMGLLGILLFTYAVTFSSNKDEGRKPGRAE
ncbi:O-antigen ligase family protein [Litoricolaceae bacterium]|nr:O-antigen ligase family protein [Litorivicinaceae bacterium]